MKAFKTIGSTSYPLSRILSISARIPEDFNLNEQEERDRACLILNQINQGFPLKTGIFVRGTSRFGLNPNEDSLIVGATDIKALSSAFYRDTGIYYSFGTMKWVDSCMGEDDMPANVLSSTVAFAKWTKGKSNWILDCGDKIYSEVTNSIFSTHSLAVLDPKALPELIEAWGERVPEKWLEHALPKP